MLWKCFRGCLIDTEWQKLQSCNLSHSIQSSDLSSVLLLFPCVLSTFEPVQRNCCFFDNFPQQHFPFGSPVDDRCQHSSTLLHKWRGENFNPCDRRNCSVNGTNDDDVVWKLPLFHFHLTQQDDDLDWKRKIRRGRCGVEKPRSVCKYLQFCSVWAI